MVISSYVHCAALESTDEQQTAEKNTCKRDMERKKVFITKIYENFNAKVDGKISIFKYIHKRGV